MKRLKTINFEDPRINQLQDNISEVLNDLSQIPILGASVITVTVKAGDNVINHQLDKVLTGWVIVGKSSAVDVYDKQPANPIPSRTLVLNSSGACNLKLLVF